MRAWHTTYLEDGAIGIAEEPSRKWRLLVSFKESWMPSLAEVPDLTGMRVLEALSVLRKADLQFAVAWGPTDQDYLRIIEQDPAAGQSVASGSVVAITIGLPSFLFDGVEVQPLPTEPGEDGSESGSSDETGTSAP